MKKAGREPEKSGEGAMGYVRGLVTGLARGLAATLTGVLWVLAAGAAGAEPVKLGVLLPYSGVYAALAEEIDAGFDMALAQHGQGLDVEVIREDTEVQPPVGLAKARKLVLQDEVDVLTGVVSSGVLGAIRDFVHDGRAVFALSGARLVHQRIAQHVDGRVAGRAGGEDRLHAGTGLCRRP
jgi:hypothetical protein